MRSATASACSRSSLSLRKARSVNSPGRASRAPSASDARDEHVEQHRPAVGVQLEHVFAGVGMWVRERRARGPVSSVCTVRVPEAVRAWRTRGRAAAEHGRGNGADRRARRCARCRRRPAPAAWPGRRWCRRPCCVIAGHHAVRPRPARQPAQSAPSTLLMRHCWAIDSTELVSQYSTRPAGKKAKNPGEHHRHDLHHLGLHRIRRRRVQRCAGRTWPPPSAGAGRRYGSRDDRSVIQSANGAWRISTLSSSTQ